MSLIVAEIYGYNKFVSGFIKKIYIYHFFDSFLLIFPIFTLLFKRDGMDTFEIALLIGIWSFITIALEVPMGVLADKYSRRNLLILGKILQLVGFGFWILGGTFFNFAMGFILWGLKNVLTSGTFEAFVYDELKAHREEKKYERVNGNIHGLDTLSIALSAIFGGAVALEYGYNLVLYLTIACGFFAVIFLLSIKPVQRIGSTHERKYVTLLKEAIRTTKNNYLLLSVMGILCLVGGTAGALDEYFALIYDHLGITIALIGLTYATMYTLSSLGGFISSRISSKRYPVTTLLIMLSGLLLLGAWYMKSYLSIGYILLSYFLLAAVKVKLETALQHVIPSHQRATISSIKSLVFELVYVLFILTFGAAAHLHGILILLFITGTVIFIAGSIALLSRLVAKSSHR